MSVIVWGAVTGAHENQKRGSWDGLDALAIEAWDDSLSQVLEEG